MAKKYVYSFGDGKAEGNARMKQELGGKGANLHEMSSLGVPVPPGFTIGIAVCEEFYENNRRYPDGLEGQVMKAVKKLEKSMGAKFGDHDNPLLVSVRSGAAMSMPGMMDTVLNLGLNDTTVEGLISKTGNERLGWDSYRRFINMFGDVVMGLEHENFEEKMEALKKKVGATIDTDLSADDLKELVKQYKAVYKKQTGEDFPQDPIDQLWKSIGAVFGSWNNPRAIEYRRLEKIPAWVKGTAVNVQAMAFGNMGETSGTGVCFSRDPATGENYFYGEYLVNAQGEDVVAGIRTPKPISELKRDMPKVYKELVAIKNRLEKHYRDMQDMEFTVQEGKLYLLQTRNGKRTAAAAVKIAVDMVKERLINSDEALMRVQPSQIDQLLHPMFDPKAERDILAKGLPASPGAATGKIVFSAEDAEKAVATDPDAQVILTRVETSPEDIKGMVAAKGILTARGGMTSHAAVVARGMGKCCVAGCEDVQIDYKKARMVVGGVTLKAGDWISLDGTTGQVMKGQVPTVQAELSGDFGKLMKWADAARDINVRTNADTPLDAEVARKFGAEGIGLCRTEHMFFEGDRISVFRKMILATDEEGRKKPLEELEKLQQGDFEGIFRAMNKLPVTVRLLDPPLHEFVPHEPKQQRELARELGLKPAQVAARVNQLHEFNPMLGHRGCRLGVSFPEVYDMQVRAILRAACVVAKDRVKVLPEIMIPLVGNAKELKIFEARIREIAKDIFKEEKKKVNYMVGTMIEVPRAAVTADEIAETAEFFSFGTNDLTQMGLGMSRDDSGSFLPEYVAQGIYAEDPFQSLDQAGVGKLVKYGIEGGRSTRPDLKVGICGEHGGDPDSVKFCHSAGMNYVSCSPYRVPIARLAAAHAVLEARNVGTGKKTKKTTVSNASAKRMGKAAAAAKKGKKKAAKKGKKKAAKKTAKKA